MLRNKVLDALYHGDLQKPLLPIRHFEVSNLSYKPKAHDFSVVRSRQSVCHDLAVCYGIILQTDLFGGYAKIPYSNWRVA